MKQNEFEKRLKELREEKHLSQREAGAIFHVKGPSISRWETGVMESDFDTLKKIAEYFGVTTDYLLGLEE